MARSTSVVAAAAALAAAFGMASATPALAETKNLQQQQQQQQQHFDQETLRSFAAATVEVEEINQSRMPELEAAGTPDEMQAVREAAQEEMVDAIEEEGLTVATYNQIHMAAETDPALAAQIGQYIQEIAPTQMQ